MKWLESLAKAFAVLAGLLIVGVAVMTCVSLLGRNTVGKTIVGDVELTAFAAGAAIALFLPWCQVNRGHIIVDFFTAKASPSTRQGLDRLGLLLTALMLGVLTWRAALGGLSGYQSGSGSMMLGFPEWIVYLGIVPGLALAAVIAAAQAVVGEHAFSPVEPSTTS
jgi:TRAP-type C4-dicarboxylate transport system permease small subunit